MIAKQRFGRSGVAQRIPRTIPSRTRTSFLKEVFEGFAGIVWARGRGSLDRRAGGVSNGGRVLLYGGTKFEEGAAIFRVLLCDAFGNRPRAFELAAGIEVDALFATMQGRMAARAFAVWIETGHQHGATP